MKMKIEFDSIEEYFEFMKFNTPQTVKQETDIKESMHTTYNAYIDLKSENKQLWQKINELNKQIEECLKPKENIISTQIEELDYSETIRKYAQSNYDNFPQIKGLKPNGQFILGKGKLSKYTMYDILKLKKHLPDLTLNWVDLGEMIGVSHFTSKNLCCAIEAGYFDKWFKEWSEMQSKLPTRKNFVENNPEKRKALMGMG